MKKKFTACLFFFAACLAFSSCEDKEPPNPPKSTLSVDKTTGKAFETEFTFTIDQVNADAIALLPYGKENGSWGGVPVTSFTGGKASVKFKYQQVGTFNVVVVTNNHNDNGDAVNTYSDPIVVTISSDKNQITAFYFDKISDPANTVIDQTAKTIVVRVPYEADATTPTSLDKLKAPTFTSDAFSTVTAKGKEQKSGETVVDFSIPVVYTVTANDGTVTNYTVTVTIADIEQNTDVKEVKGKETSKSAKDKVIPAYISNTDNIIVLYDVYGTTAAQFDSIAFEYTLDGTFAHAILSGQTAHLKQGEVLNLTTSKTLTVYSQDSVATKETWKIYAVQAPLLTLTFDEKDPLITGKNDNFDIEMKVLKEGTVDTKMYHTKGVITLPTGVVFQSVTVNGNPIDLTAGANLNFATDQKFVITVQDNSNGGIIYSVTYTAALNEF